MFELSVFSGFAVLPDFCVELISEFKIAEFLSLGFCGQSLVQLWPSRFGHVVLLRMFGEKVVKPDYSQFSSNFMHQWGNH
jgi:hypothetical protein